MQIVDLSVVFFRAWLASPTLAGNSDYPALPVCRNYFRFWLGMMNEGGNACGPTCFYEWNWVDGSAVNWNNWATGQPGEGARLGLMYGCDGYRWHTLPERYLHRYICQRCEYRHISLYIYILLTAQEHN